MWYNGIWKKTKTFSVITEDHKQIHNLPSLAALENTVGNEAKRLDYLI